MKRTTILFIVGLSILSFACKNQNISAPTTEQIKTNIEASGTSLEIQFFKGKYHNHPTFAFWVEDLEGNYIETLYVTKYLGTGIFGHGSLGEGKWDNKPGEAKRPASLPYWLHKKGVMGEGENYLPSKENPIVDAITAATPQSDFILSTRSTKELPQKFRLLMEINQPWDWNEYWNNTKFTDNADYKSSCQPALVYAVTVDQSKKGNDFYLNPIGHSHYSGKDGELYTDITTLTTAKEIAHKVVVRLK